MRWLNVAVALTMVISAGSLAARGREVRIRVDGAPLRTSPAPVIRGGRVFIPILAFQKIGLASYVTGRRTGWVGWPDSDGIIHYTANVRTHVIGQDPAERKRVRLPGTPFMRRGVLMVPLKSWASDRQGSSLTAKWNPRTRTVDLRRSRDFVRQIMEIDYAGKPYEKWYSKPIIGDYRPKLLAE